MLQRIVIIGALPPTGRPQTVGTDATTVPWLSSLIKQIAARSDDAAVTDRGS